MDAEHSRDRPRRARGSQCRPEDGAAAARGYSLAMWRGHGTPAHIGCIPAGIGHCGGGVISVMRANSAAELSIVHALNPPPGAIRWLATGVFWLRLGWGHRLSGRPGPPGTAAGGGPADHRGRRCDLSPVRAARSCLGAAAGRPAIDALAGVDTRYPVTQLAVTITVAVTAAVSEPPLAPPDVVPHRGGGHRRCHRRPGFVHGRPGIRPPPWAGRVWCACSAPSG